MKFDVRVAVPVSAVIILPELFHMACKDELDDTTGELRQIEAFRKAQAEINKQMKQSVFN